MHMDIAKMGVASRSVIVRSP